MKISLVELKLQSVVYPFPNPFYFSFPRSSRHIEGEMKRIEIDRLVILCVASYVYMLYINECSTFDFTYKYFVSKLHKIKLQLNVHASLCSR